MKCGVVQAVKRNKDEYGLPLHIVTYQELFGWTMDAIVKATGKRNNCAYAAVMLWVCGPSAADGLVNLVMTLWPMHDRCAAVESYGRCMMTDVRVYRCACVRRLQARSVACSVGKHLTAAPCY